MRQRIIHKPQINSGAGKKPDSVKPKSGSFQSTFDKVPEYLWQRAVLERRISCCRWLAPCGMWRTLILKPKELWTMTVGSPSGHTPLCGTDAWHQHEGDWNHCHFHSCLQRNMTPEVGPWFPGLLLGEQDKSNVRDSPLHCDFLGILWLMLINCPKCIQGETCRGMLCSQSSVHAFHSGFPGAGLQRWEAFGIKLHKYGKLWAEVICLQIFFMPKIHFPLKSCFSF